MTETPAGQHSVERLVHFNCAICHKWWSVGDADVAKRVWFCAWCGQRHQFNLSNPSPDSPPAQDDDAGR